MGKGDALSGVPCIFPIFIHILLDFFADHLYLLCNLDHILKLFKVAMSEEVPNLVILQEDVPVLIKIIGESQPFTHCLYTLLLLPRLLPLFLIEYFPRFFINQLVLPDLHYFFDTGFVRLQIFSLFIRLLL